MINDNEDAAAVLWNQAEEYFQLARLNFYLDYTCPPVASESWPVSEVLASMSGLHLPAGAGRDHEAVVHFLFPNLDQAERNLLVSILGMSEPSGGRRSGETDRKAEYVESVEAFNRSEIMRKATALQIQIIEKFILLPT